MKNKRNTQIYKRNTSKHGLSRQRKQMSFFASSLYFFITHSYFEQTRKKKTLLSSNVWFLTHNKSRVIFIYPADNWLFIYIRVRRMDWSWLTVAWTKKRASTILRLIRFNCEARDLWLNCALQTLLSYWWNLLFFLINQKKKKTDSNNKCSFLWHTHLSLSPPFRYYITVLTSKLPQQCFK